MWNKFLKTSIGNDVQINNLRQWISKLCMGLDLPEMLMLHGPGPCGKGLLLKVIRMLISPKAILDRMPDVKNPVQRMSLEAKRLIIMPQDQIDAINNYTANIKLILTGGKITGRQKYQREMNKFMINCGIIGTTQFMPPLEPSIQRRIIPIEMKRPQVLDPELLKKISGNIEKVLHWAKS